MQEIGFVVGQVVDFVEVFIGYLWLQCNYFILYVWCYFFVVCVQVVGFIDQFYWVFVGKQLVVQVFGGGVGVFVIVEDVVQCIELFDVVFVGVFGFYYFEQQ